MRKDFDLEVLTRERTVLSVQAEEIIAPGVDGYLGVRPGHAPLITALDIGILYVRPVNGEEETLAVSGGFMEVRPEKTVVLAEAAERASEIDRERVQRALRRAEARLAQADPADADTERARRALARAFNRLQALDKR